MAGWITAGHRVRRTFAEVRRRGETPFWLPGGRTFRTGPTMSRELANSTMEIPGNTPIVWGPDVCRTAKPW